MSEIMRWIVPIGSLLNLILAIFNLHNSKNNLESAKANAANAKINAEFSATNAKNAKMLADTVAEIIKKVEAAKK